MMMKDQMSSASFVGRTSPLPPPPARDLSRPPRSPSLAPSLAAGVNAPPLPPSPSLALRSFIVCVRQQLPPQLAACGAAVVAATADCRGAPPLGKEGNAGLIYESTQSQSTSKSSTAKIALLSDPNEETLIIVPPSLARSSSGGGPKEGSSAYTTSETAAAAAAATFGNGVDGSDPTAHLLLPPPTHGGFELDMGFMSLKYYCRRILLVYTCRLILTMGPSMDRRSSGAPWPGDCCCFPVILDFCRGGIVVALVVAVGPGDPRWSHISDCRFR